MRPILKSFQWGFCFCLSYHGFLMTADIVTNVLARSNWDQIQTVKIKVDRCKATNSFSRLTMSHQCALFFAWRHYQAFYEALEFCFVCHAESTVVVGQSNISYVFLAIQNIECAAAHLWSLWTRAAWKNEQPQIIEGMGKLNRNKKSHFSNIYQIFHVTHPYFIRITIRNWSKQGRICYKKNGYSRSFLT